MNLCVYCSSSDKLEPRFYEAADELGRAMAERGHTLVYGGGSVGIMGRLARAVHAHGGKVIGVIPSFLRTAEVSYEASDELVVTDDMRTRKAEMERRANAFLILPGGLGTLEELAEMLVLKVLRQTHKPLVIFNQDGFYDPLLAFFDHLCEHRFASAACRKLYAVADSVPEVFDALERAANEPVCTDAPPMLAYKRADSAS
jgi:cytokinin riboside 5'-monophosphate phosphoribohydrolase